MIILTNRQNMPIEIEMERHGDSVEYTIVLNKSIKEILGK
jgi:hypothetical protein